MLVVSGLFFINYMAQKSLPDYNRIVESSMINHETKVFRDNYAVPTIKGKTNKDYSKLDGRKD